VAVSLAGDGATNRAVSCRLFSTPSLAPSTPSHGFALARPCRASLAARIGARSSHLQLNTPRSAAVWFAAASQFNGLERGSADYLCFGFESLWGPRYPAPCTAA
jgi:hypothetical protein